MSGNRVPFPGQLAESRKNLLDEMSKEHQENLKAAEKRHEVHTYIHIVL